MYHLTPSGTGHRCFSRDTRVLSMPVFAAAIELNGDTAYVVKSKAARLRIETNGSTVTLTLSCGPVNYERTVERTFRGTVIVGAEMAFCMRTGHTHADWYRALSDWYTMVNGSDFASRYKGAAEEARYMFVYGKWSQKPDATRRLAMTWSGGKNGLKDLHSVSV